MPREDEPIQKRLNAYNTAKELYVTIPVLLIGRNMFFAVRAFIISCVDTFLPLFDSCTLKKNKDIIKKVLDIEEKVVLLLATGGGTTGSGCITHIANIE